MGSKPPASLQVHQGAVPLQSSHLLSGTKPPHTPHPQSNILQLFTTLGTQGESILLDPHNTREIRDTIRKLPSGQPPGTDGISGGMLKITIGSNAPELQQLCLQIWEEEWVSAEWKKGFIPSFYKNKREWWGTVSYSPMLSVPSKVLRLIYPLLLAKCCPNKMVSHKGVPPKTASLL